MSPTVSVIIPVYNGTNYLHEAIDSVLAQTFTDYELLVIDDGSTDGTWEVIQSYGTRLRGVRKPNGGVASALNLGIREAQGKWIAWLSHDDAFLPHKLAVQIDCMTKNPTYRVCYTDMWVVDEQSERQGLLPMPAYPPERFVRHLFQCMFVCGSTTLVHRECFETVGLFDESLRYAQDADMWLRIARHFRFIHIPEPLICWRYHSAQGSRNEKRMLADRHEYLSRCLQKFAIEDFFPEIMTAKTKARAVAQARTYLAMTLLSRHREVDLAIQQYFLALRTWPSLLNPASLRLMTLLLGGWGYYWLGRNVASFLRSVNPSTDKVPPGDLITASRVVDYEIV